MDALAISQLSRGQLQGACAQFIIDCRPVEVALCRKVAMQRKIWLPSTMEEAKALHNSKAPPGALELF